MHRIIGMSEAAGFAAIEIEDQLVPKRAHHHIGIEHMISLELMAAKVKEAVAARLAGRGGLAGLGMTLADLGGLGYKIAADPSTPLLAAYAAWKKVYADLAAGFGAQHATEPDRGPVQKDLLGVIEIEKLLAIERATVETGQR